MEDLRVRAKSINRVGRFVAFQYVQLPQMGIEKGQLVQRLGPPTPMVLIAFKDQFAIGPITDLEPVWNLNLKIDRVADIAEQEAVNQETAAASGLVLPDGVEAPKTKTTAKSKQVEALVEGTSGEEQPSADGGLGETVIT